VNASEEQLVSEYCLLYLLFRVFFYLSVLLRLFCIINTLHVGVDYLIIFYYAEYWGCWNYFWNNLYLEYKRKYLEYKRKKYQLTFLALSSLTLRPIWGQLHMQLPSKKHQNHLRDMCKSMYSLSFNFTLYPGYIQPYGISITFSCTAKFNKTQKIFARKREYFHYKMDSMTKGKLLPKSLNYWRI
jgi:hypothetical protein